MTEQLNRTPHLEAAGILMHMASPDAPGSSFREPSTTTPSSMSGASPPILPTLRSALSTCLPSGLDPRGPPLPFLIPSAFFAYGQGTITDYPLAALLPQLGLVLGTFPVTSGSSLGPIQGRPPIPLSHPPMTPAEPAFRIVCPTPRLTTQSLPASGSRRPLEASLTKTRRTPTHSAILDPSAVKVERSSLKRSIDQEGSENSTPSATCPDKSSPGIQMRPVKRSRSHTPAQAQAQAEHRHATSSAPSTESTAKVKGDLSLFPNLQLQLQREQLDPQQHTELVLKVWNRQQQVIKFQQLQKKKQELKAQRAQKSRRNKGSKSLEPPSSSSSIPVGEDHDPSAVLPTIEEILNGADLVGSEALDEVTAEGAKPRRRISAQQVHVLDQVFAVEPFPGPSTKKIIAKKLGMTERSVTIWFQNKRARLKRIDDSPDRSAEQESQSAGRREVTFHNLAVGFDGKLDILPECGSH